MSAKQPGTSGSPAPQWAILPEPSPSVALSDDDLGSMRDELEPTPPVLQSFSFAAKKRKPDVPASEDERAAGTRQVKKTKGLNNVVGVEQVERASLSGAHIPLPSSQSQAPPASPLDNVRPRIQVAKKRPRIFKPTKLIFQLEKDIAGPDPALPPLPAASDNTAASSSKFATQPASSSSISFAKPSYVGASGTIVLSSRPAASTKGKEVDRSNVEPGRGLGSLTKSKDPPSLTSNVPTKPTALKAPRPALWKASTVPSPSTPVPKPRSSVSGTTTKAVNSSFRLPGLALGASSSKAVPAPLSRAKAKRRLASLSGPSSSSDEGVQTGGGSRAVGGRGVRNSLGLTKVPIPKAGVANARTGRRESDSSISAEEFPTMRKKKKIKLTHATQPARLAAPSNLTATQQRRKSALEPRVKVIEVIELSSGTDEPAPSQPAPSQPASTRAKRRASAPAVREDVINITDSDEDEVRPPLQSTQSLPAIELKYDADGSIVIEDDEDEPVEKPVSALAKTEKPASTTARSAFAQPPPAPSPSPVPEVDEQVEDPSGDPEPWEQPIEDVPLEERLQDLDIGAQEDEVLQGSPELVKDMQLIEEPETSGSPSEATPSEDAELAISTDIQLQISSDVQDLVGSPAAVSPPVSGGIQPQGSRWITPLSPSAAKSKTIFGGPKGFFKDVFALHRKSRSVSQEIHDAGPSQIHEVDMGSAAPPEPIIPEAEVSTGSECSLSLGGLELAYPSSRSASAGHATSQPLGLGSPGSGKNDTHTLPPVQEPACNSASAGQPPAEASLQDIIMFAYKEQQRKNRECKEVIDLTSEDDGNEVTQDAVPSNSKPVSAINEPCDATLAIAVVSAAPVPAVPTIDPSSPEALKPPVATQQLSLDSIRFMRLQKKTSRTRASPDTPSSHQASAGAPSRASLSSGLRQHPTPIEVATRLELPRRVQPKHTQVQKHIEKPEANSEIHAAPAVHWRRPHGGQRYGPSPPPSPSPADASEPDIIDDISTSGGDDATTTRRPRPRRKRNIAVLSAPSSASSPSRHSTRSGSSSIGPAELSDDFDPAFVEPRIASPSDDPDYEPSSFELIARNAGFEVITWKKNHRLMMKEYANHHVLAKDLPHELQDRINALGPRARREGDMQVKLFEQAIIENTFEDEPHAPLIRIVNEFDDELTPPFEFHYSNLMWHGEGVPKPDVANLQGCGCIGPCDPESKTCRCLAHQKEYHAEGFLYHEDGKNKGQLKAIDYPIFECNDFCGCSDDCPNRVVQHGRKYPIEIRKTQFKGWGVFAGYKKIPRNTYLGIYAGEYLMEAEAERRGVLYNKFGRTYLFDVDFYHLREGQDDWSSKYSIDAYHAGNFTRYLNHSCNPNCFINPCYINEANLDKPLLAVFTQRDVLPGEELCFSYYGNEDDEDNAAKNAAERVYDDAVYVPCRCGASNCRGRMWKE